MRSVENIRVPLFLSSLFFSVTTSSLSLDDRDVSTLYADSKVVVEGTPIRVEGECRDDKCPLAYTLKINVIHKGLDKSIDQITICPLKPLNFRENYVLFLIGSDPLDKNLCEYYLEQDSLFSRSSYGKVYRIGSGRAHRVIFDGGRRYIADRVLEEGFDSELDTAKAFQTE